MSDEFEAISTFPIASLKYVPHARSQYSWAGPDSTEPVRRDAKGTAIPPDSLLAGYADTAEGYLASGEHHVNVMRDKLQASGFALGSAKRILDLGCGIGRMIRHLFDHNQTAETWGVDISGPHIQWCKWNLSPPYHFATTTTIPHLPFADGYFDLVYAGSVFTHIDDLADAWLLEVRRVLSPGGRAYVTLHDEATIDLLESHPIHSRAWLADQLRADPIYQQRKGNFGILVVGRDLMSQVYYQRDYFARMAAPAFTIAGAYPAVHGYQTAYVLIPS